MSDNDKRTPEFHVVTPPEGIEPLRIMLDLETVGTRPGCGILQIGCALFTEHAVVASHSWGIMWRACVEQTGYVDDSTLEWWEKQDPAVKERVFSGRQNGSALREFIDLCEWVRPIEIWADSPSFDIEIFRAACDTYGKSAPWPFTHRQEVCYRTLRRSYMKRRAIVLANFPEQADNWPDAMAPFNGQHDAKADAEEQARRVIYMERMLHRAFPDFDAERAERRRPL